MFASIAQSMNFLSFSVNAGRLMWTEGTFTLLCPFIRPSFITLQRSRPSLLSTTDKSTEPSSIRISEPMGTSTERFGYVVLRQPFVQGDVGSSSISSISPVCATKPTESFMRVSLTSGPLVSINIAMRSETFRTFSTIFPAPSIVACAELMRTTFIPFS